MKRVLKFLLLLIPVIIAYYLLKDIYKNWSLIKGYAVKTNYLYLALSYLSFVVANLFMTGIWFILLKKLKAVVTLPASISIWAVSTLGKYIPGKGWQFVGIVYIAKKLGINYDVSITASLMGQILTIIAGLVISFSIIKTHVAPVFVTIFIAFSLIFIYPKFLNMILDVLRKWTKKNIVHVDLTMRDTLFVTFLYLIGWLVFGLSFNLLLMSILPNWPLNILESAKVYVSSYLVGLFAIFVPGGLGIREGVMAYLLAKSTPGYMASFISVLARLVVTLAELTLTGFGLVYLHKRGISVFLKRPDNRDRHL